MNIVGRQVKCVDAYGKVTGEAEYTVDLEPRDILYGKIVYSTIVNGLVKSIDLTGAYQVPGVVRIVTCFGVPDCQFPAAGHPQSVEKKHQDICDRKILGQRVRLHGGNITAIITEDEVAAARVTRLIKMEYEEYTPIVAVKVTMTGGAISLHPDLRKDNATVHSHMTMGDSDSTYEGGLKKAGSYCESQKIIPLEKEYDTSRTSHYHIELSTSQTYVDASGKITVVSSTQVPHIARCCATQALGVPIGRARIIGPYIGGGFGSKQDVLYKPLNAFLTMPVERRPVRLEISREETISGTHIRHAIKRKYKGLATKDGCILARKLGAYANSGAYASHSHAICTNCGNAFKNLHGGEFGAEVDCFTVYTSSPTADAMRVYGIPQVAWFAEYLTNDLVDAIDIDLCEFKLENCMEGGFVDPANGTTSHSYSLKRCIEEGHRHIRWDEKWSSYRDQTGPVRRGMGMAVSRYKTDVHLVSPEAASARTILDQDGSVQLCVGAAKIGQGAGTVFAQVVSWTIGTIFDKVCIVPTQGTDVILSGTGAYASRQTCAPGMACKKRGEEFRLRILEYAAYMLSYDISDLSKTVYVDKVKTATALLRGTLGFKEGELVSVDMSDIENNKIVASRGDPVLLDPSVVAGTAFYSLDRSVHITAEVTNQRKGNTFSSGCCFMEIGMGIPLELVMVKDVISVHDSGALINPMTARARVHGGMSMGLGYVLLEELLVDEETGRPLNNSLLDYGIPTVMDMPDLDATFIGLEDPIGPYGNKSLDKPPAIPAAPAIRNTILSATRVYMDVTPTAVQRFIRKFKEKGLI